MESEEVIILGAGLSGLTAAYELELKGIPYLVLEARELIGGRIHTITTDKGATIEMGATWFADKHVHLMGLIRHLNVPYQHQYTGSRVLYDYANPGRTAQLFQLPETTESQYLFTEGTHSLLATLYQRLDPNRILLIHHVRKLDFKKESIAVLADEKTFKARKVINTLPPNLFLNTIEVSPQLSEDLKVVSKGTHTWMGESIKAGLEYSEVFWRKHEIGTLFSQFGPVQELHDHQHEGKGSNVLKGFINLELHSTGQEVREQKVLEQMKYYFGPDLPNGTYFEKDWQSDPLTFYPYQSDVMPH